MVADEELVRIREVVMGGAGCCEGIHSTRPIYCSRQVEARHHDASAALVLAS